MSNERVARSLVGLLYTTGYTARCRVAHTAHSGKRTFSKAVVYHRSTAAADDTRYCLITADRTAAVAVANRLIARGVLARYTCSRSCRQQTAESASTDMAARAQTACYTAGSRIFRQRKRCVVHRATDNFRPRGMRTGYTAEITAEILICHCLRRVDVYVLQRANSRGEQLVGNHAVGYQSRFRRVLKRYHRLIQGQILNSRTFQYIVE